MSLRAKFLGAVGTVTGSCTLLHYGLTDSYYMVDCGMYQGFPGAEERNRREFPFDPKRLAAVLLTHAHVDHIGLLPRLVHAGFRGKIICTRATARFTMAALSDTGAGSGQLWPPDAVSRLEGMFQCPDDDSKFVFGHSYPLDQDLFFSFLRSAHVAGSVGIELRVNINTSESRTFTFSGDVGPASEESGHGGLQKHRQYPNPRSSVVVCESTYGGKVRRTGAGTFVERSAALARTLNEAFARGPDPVVFFPTFALQRAQDLVVEIDHVLRHHDVAIPGRRALSIVVDSAMAAEHATIMWNELGRRDAKARRRWVNPETPLLSGMTESEIDRRLSALLCPSGWDAPQQSGNGAWTVHYGRPGPTTGPRIILAGPGMCNARKSLQYLGEFAPNPQATIVFSGYLPQSSPGFAVRQLGTGAEGYVPPAVIQLGDVRLRPEQIRAATVNLGEYYSGHADEDGLVDFLLRQDTRYPSPPMTVVLNHGDRRGRESLRDRLLQEAANPSTPGPHRPLKAVILPETHQGWFDLIAGEWEECDPAGALDNERVAGLERQLTDLAADHEALCRRVELLEAAR